MRERNGSHVVEITPQLPENLNCTGFTDTRLYIYSQYLKTLPIERMLDPGINASDFNDDVLGGLLMKFTEQTLLNFSFDLINYSMFSFLR